MAQHKAKSTGRKKVAYLFGAGATHAELVNLEPNLHRGRQGLLIGDVSARVIEKARSDKRYLQNVELVSGTAGAPKNVEVVSEIPAALNIELLISLIENSKIHDWAYKTGLLKDLVAKDIKGILTAPRTRRFYLHKALIELHNHRLVNAREELIGLISLNYDGVLDLAYQQYYGEPNYCFTLGAAENAGAIPLLKLHGSFNWQDRIIRGRRRTIEIIPLGANKTYLHAPYGFIWSRALEVLTACDTLRVVGCSLSQNDSHLVDLLFKAHLEKDASFEMEIVGPQDLGTQIRTNYGFFSGVKTLLEIEKNLIPESNPSNPYKTWLKYKSISMLGSRRARRLRYLQQVVA